MEIGNIFAQYIHMKTQVSVPSAEITRQSYVASCHNASLIFYTPCISLLNSLSICHRTSNVQFIYKHCPAPSFPSLQYTWIYPFWHLVYFPFLTMFNADICTCMHRKDCRTKPLWGKDFLLVWNAWIFLHSHLNGHVEFVYQKNNKTWTDYLSAQGFHSPSGINLEKEASS